MHNVVLVQCTDSKRDGEHAAHDLYDESAYFRRQRSYAKMFADKWYVQSAKHGLLAPGESVSDYDRRPKDIDDIGAWAEGIATYLERRHAPERWAVTILGGAAYADPVTPRLEERGYEVLEPMRGLKFGRRLRWLKNRVAEAEHATL